MSKENTHVSEAVKTCFMIMPIGDHNSDERIMADGLMELLEPVFKKYDYKLVAAHRITSVGSITGQIIKFILDSELVLANLTGLNSNVMYELGVRHATGKHTIAITQDGTKLPFDVTIERTIFFQNRITYSVSLVGDIESFLQQIKLDDLADNPVTRVSMQKALHADVTIKDTDQLILKRLDALEENLVSNTYYNTIDIASKAINTKSIRIELSYHKRDKNTNLIKIQDIMTYLSKNYITGEYSARDYYDNKFVVEIRVSKLKIDLNSIALEINSLLELRNYPKPDSIVINEY